MPSARRRRFASTVKPLIATIAIRSIPTDAKRSEMVLGLSVLGATGGRCGADIGTDGRRRDPVRVEQHGHHRRFANLTRQDEGEVVARVLRVLHDANHPPCGPSLVPEISDLHAERRRHRRAGRDLICRTGQRPVDE